MKKTKVIHVLTDKNFGGAGRWLINYLTYHNRAKFDVKVMLPKDSVLKERVEDLDVAVIELASMSDKSLDIKALKEMKQVISEEQPDVVHTHASLTARLASKLKGVKCIIHTKHCLDAPSHGIKKYIKLAINKTLSHKIIACSGAVKKELLASGIDEERIAFIYNGVIPLKKIQQADIDQLKVEWHIPKDHVVIGQMGRLEWIKGTDIFVEAAREVLKARKNVTFLVVGTGSLEKALKDRVSALELEENIIFTGYQKDVEGMLNLLDINVMASRSEALCLSLIEGMSLEVPSVGSETGGIVEVIKHTKTGEIVPVEDKEALANALIKLIDNPSLAKKYAVAGKKHMQQVFTAEKMAKEVEKLY